MKWKKGKIFAGVLFLFFLPALLQAANPIAPPAPTSGEGCDPNTPEALEPVFVFPNASQTGQVLTASYQSLGNYANIRSMKNWDWLSARRTELLSAGIDGQRLSKLSVYRNRCSGEAALTMEPPQAAYQPSGRYAAEASAQFAPARRGVSKGRRILATIIGAGAPIALGIAAPGIGYYPGMLAAGQVSEMLMTPGRQKTSTSRSRDTGGIARLD